MVEEVVDEAAWEIWLKYRKEIKKPLKEPSWPIARRKMAVLGDKQMQAVEHSIANGYLGLWCPRDWLSPVLSTKRPGWT